MKPNLYIRMTALVLVPCLIGDSVMASTVGAGHRACPKFHSIAGGDGAPPLRSLFTAQAITPRVVAGEGPLAPTEAKIAQAQSAKRIHAAIKHLTDFGKPKDLAAAYGLRLQDASDIFKVIEAQGNKMTPESLRRKFGPSLALAGAAILKEIEAAGIDDPLMRHLAEFPTAKDLADAYHMDPMWKTNIFNVIRSLGSALTQESLLYALNHSFGPPGQSKGRALIKRAASRISAKGPTGPSAHIWDAKVDCYTPLLPSPNKDQRAPSTRMQSRFGVHIHAADPGSPNALSGGGAAALPAQGWHSLSSREALLDFIRARLRVEGIGAMTLLIAPGISSPFQITLQIAGMASAPEIGTGSWYVDEGISQLEQHLQDQPFSARKTTEHLTRAKIKARKTRGKAVLKNRLMSECWEIVQPAIAKQIDKLEKKLDELEKLSASASGWARAAASEPENRSLLETAEYALADLADALRSAGIALMQLPASFCASQQRPLAGFKMIYQGADHLLNPARRPDAASSAA